MKVIYIHQYFCNPQMSGGTRSFEIAKRLVSAGHDVNLITSWREPTNKVDWFESNERGIKVFWLPNLYSNEMSFMKRVLSFLRFSLKASKKACSMNNVDIIFASSTPLTIAIPALITSKLKKIPMVFEVRDLWPSVPIAMGILKNPIGIFFAKLLEITAYKNSQHIIALAPGMRDEIISLGINESKVSVVTNGCDPEFFLEKKNKAKFLKLRRSYDWLSQRKLILFAGTLGRANGVDFLADIAKEMMKIDQEVRFLIIGDGSEREFIKKKAKSLKIFNKNFFMMESVSKDEVIDWILTADFTTAFFSGPRILSKDGVQNKFFDSLSAGKPIACNFKGFQSEIAAEHDIGVILDLSSPRKSALQLFEKLSDSKWLRNAELSALKLAHNEFHYNKLASRINVILNSALKNN